MNYNKLKQNFKAKKTGFTLIEVVIAIGIISSSLMVMIALLAEVSNSVYRIYDTKAALAAKNKIDAYFETLPFKYAYTNLYSAGSNGHEYYYCWDQMSENDDNEVSFNDSIVITKSNPDSERLKKIRGRIYVASLEVSPILMNKVIGEDDEGSEITYTGSLPAYDNYTISYIPILIKIYPVSKTDFASGKIPNVEDDYSPIYQYTSAKSR